MNIKPEIIPPHALRTDEELIAECDASHRRADIWVGFTAIVCAIILLALLLTGNLPI